MGPVLPITRDMLVDLGGWQVFQQAQGMVQAGQVQGVQYAPPILSARIENGGPCLVTRLKLGRTLAATETLCTCRDAKLYGTMCAHVVAAGLEYLRKRAVEEATPSPAGSMKSVNAAIAGTSGGIAGSVPGKGPAVTRGLMGVPSGGKVPASVGGATASASRISSVASGPPYRRVLLGNAPAEARRLEPMFLLPLTFPEGADRLGRDGGIRLIIEARVMSQATAMSTVPEGRKEAFQPWDSVIRANVLSGRETLFAVTEDDEAVLSVVEKACGGTISGMCHISRDHLHALFSAMAVHPSVWLGKKSPVRIRRSTVKPSLRMETLPGGELRLTLEKPATPPGKVVAIPGGRWVWREGHLDELWQLPQPYASLEKAPVTLKRTEIVNFLTREMPALSRLVSMEGTGALAGGNVNLETRSPEIYATLDGSLAGLSLQLEAAYCGGRFRYPLKPGDADGVIPSPVYEPDDEGVGATKAGTSNVPALTFWCRDHAAERVAIGEARSGGFARGDRRPDAWFISGERQVGTFLANQLPRWRKKWRVIEGARMQELTSKLDYIEPDVTLVPTGRDIGRPRGDASSFDAARYDGEDWLSLDIRLRSRQGRTELSPSDVQRWLQTGQSHRREAAGRILLFPNQAWDQMQLVLADCDVRQDPGRQRVRAHFAPYLANALDAQGWGLSQRSTWRPPEEKPDLALGTLPKELAETVRPYQAQGIAWLSGLAQNGLCGLLADEMGLGKTLQMLAFLQQLLAKAGGNVLIVCPTSLVHNWRQEAERFTPGLRVLVVEGAGRASLWSAVEKADLVVTSYALLRRDIERYTGLEFTAVVLDEAQHIKNRSSLNAQSAKALRAKLRYVLTGTPLENSLQDLWSIYDFLLPNYLGTSKDFKERYETPIARDKDEAAAQRLRQRLRPFFLRRTKKEVALQLPDKLEQVAWCELTDEQREVYQAILEKGRREVFDGSGKAGQGKNKLAILTTLLRLRQACCHLGLLPGEGGTSDVSADADGAAWKEPSGKLDHFLELLDEAVDGGHRILVFSQFVRLLHLVRAELDTRGVAYCYLDGATQNRMDEVKRFQTSSDIPVFLISLKAGGVGLNLTAADTVVLFDPWWNPAVEDQATARAHRIGQQRVVNAYKMIARGTVEEKILKLQAKKQALFASSMASEELFVDSLTWDEVKELFA
ncbi:hypothetical protein DB346_06530 [Verrucomicrobia bacterium LW23]|nr:hypothetical protein DB346_06530 [Verrucomicrobia bacterium LW23]